MDFVEQYETLVKIAKKNGLIKLDYEFVKLKLIEEMAELTQAILKCDEDNITEEAVDVFIMLNQLAINHLDKYKVSKMIEYKINRTMDFLGIKKED